MFSDTDTLSFTLTYGGTLVAALLMLIGHLTAGGALLVSDGIAWPAIGDACPRPGQGALCVGAPTWFGCRGLLTFSAYDF